MSKKQNEVAVKTNETSAALFDPSKIRLKARLVVPTISLERMPEGAVMYFRAESEPTVKDKVDPKTGEIEMKEGKPATITTMQITELSTGAFGEIVLGAIVANAMKTVAQHGPITGRYFALQKGASKGAGKARMWNLDEFENQE